MEAPASLDAEDVRDEKVKVLKQIRPIRPEDCVIGQFEGYQDDPQIKEINEKRGYQSRHLRELSFFLLVLLFYFCIFLR